VIAGSVSREESTWLTQVVQGKVEAGHCHTHKKDTGKPCEDGKQFHMKISEEMATNLCDMADILDPVLKI